MKLTRFVFAIGTIFILFGCAIKDKKYTFLVSIYELIVNPKKYSGHNVVVSGYFYSLLGHEWALYPSKESAKILDKESSIYLVKKHGKDSEYINKYCANRHVTVIGEFVMHHNLQYLKIEKLIGIATIDKENAKCEYGYAK